MRWTALGAVVLLAGQLPGGGAAAEDRPARAEITYECGLPSGVRQVKVGFEADFPGSGAPGKPIQPGEVTAKVPLPKAAVDELLPAGTRSVSGSADLTAHVAQNGDTAEAAWRGLTAPPATVPATGDLVLAHAGEVPAVTVRTPGEVTFSVGELTLQVTAATSATPSSPQPDEGEQAADGPARVECAPAGDQATRLATVAVPEADDAPSPSESAPSDEPGDGEQKDGGRKGIAVGPKAADEPVRGRCPDDPPPLGMADLDPEFLPKAPEGATVTEGTNIHSCAYPVGHSNVEKLGGATVLNDPHADPEPINVVAIVRNVRKWDTANKYTELDHMAELNLPPSRTTFLTFGFQPVTATVHFDAGPLTIASHQDQMTTVPSITKVGYHQTLRLSDVKVNGTPLDVGPRCRTSKKVRTVLSGTQAEYDLFKGGILKGEIDIPAFRGCGTAAGEDLNKLFTGTISGPGNFLKIVQGPLCTKPDQTEPLGNCPPQIPELPGS